MKQSALEKAAWKWLSPDIHFYAARDASGVHYLSIVMPLAFSLGVCWILYSISLAKTHSLKDFVQDCGVRVKRLRRAAREIERKVRVSRAEVMVVLQAATQNYKELPPGRAHRPRDHGPRARQWHFTRGLYKVQHRRHQLRVVYGHLAR